ncbi:MAG: V-type ATP synthase subunit F [Clostridia bacterium]
MKFYLLSTEDDTLTGMRLAGIEGEKVSTKQEFETAIESVFADKNIGLLLVTASVSKQFSTEIMQLKKEAKILVTEVPDINTVGAPNDSITRYVREAIGIKI